MKNNPRVSPEKQLSSGWTDSSGEKLLLRPEQMLEESIMDLAFNFFNAGDLMPKTCAGVIASAKICLQLPEHCRYVASRRTQRVFRMLFQRW